MARLLSSVGGLLLLGAAAVLVLLVRLQLPWAAAVLVVLGVLLHRMLPRKRPRTEEELWLLGYRDLFFVYVPVSRVRVTEDLHSRRLKMKLPFLAFDIRSLYLLLVLLVAIRIDPASAQEHPASAPQVSHGNLTLFSAIGLEGLSVENMSLQNGLLVTVAVVPCVSVFMRLIMLKATSADRSKRIFGTLGTSAQIMYSLIWLIYSMVNYKTDIDKVATTVFLLQSVLSYIYLLFIDDRQYMTIIVGIFTIPCVVSYFVILQYGFTVPKSWEAPLSFVGIAALIVLQVFQIDEITHTGHANGCVDQILIFLDVVLDLVVNACTVVVTVMWHRDLLYIMVVSGLNVYCCVVKIGLFAMQRVRGRVNHGDGVENVNHGDGIEHVNPGDGIELIPVEGAGAGAEGNGDV